MTRGPSAEKMERASAANVASTSLPASLEFTVVKAEDITAALGATAAESDTISLNCPLVLSDELSPKKATAP